MAKQPTKPASDPAALAFSAVETALKDSVFSHDMPETKPGKTSGEREPSPKTDREKAASKIASKANTVANDDRFTSSKILYSMQSQPSNVPTLVAIGLSSVWAFCTLLVGWLRFGGQLSDPEQVGSFIGSIDFAGLLAILTLPIMGIFAVAILIRRAQDLRIAATSMTQAAIRLAEPETTAAEKVASVGQAVRREVNALGDGLERALSRAGELEVMIHNEVTSLERTYSDNESRLRSLIEELASQRDSVVTNSERVREAIAEAHAMMVKDIDQVGMKLSGTIVERGDDVRAAIEAATTVLNDSFSERAENFVAAVDSRSSDMLASVDQSADRLHLTLDEKTARLASVFQDRTDNIANLVDQRMANLTDELDSRAVTLAETIQQQTAGLADALKEGSGTIISSLEGRGYAMSGALEAIGSRIVNDISDKSGEAETALMDVNSKLNETMSIHVNSMESRLQSAMLELGGALEESTEHARTVMSETGAKTLANLDARVDEVSLVLDARIQAVDSVVGEKGERLIQVLERHNQDFGSRANLLETALVEKSASLTEAIAGHTQSLSGEISLRTKEFAEKLGTRTQQLSDAMGSRTKEFGEVLGARTQKLSDVLASRSSEFDSTLANRTQALSDTLTNETAHIDTLLESRTKELASAVTDRTVEMAKTLDVQSTAIRARVDESMRGITETIEGRADHMASVITGKVSEVNAAIGADVDSAVARLSEAESGISARLQEVSETIGDATRHAAEVVDSGVQSARKSIIEMVDQRLGTLPEAITSRANITADRLSELSDNINVSMTKTMSDLEAGATKIEDTINFKITKATDAVAVEVEQSATRMDVAVRSALDQIRLVSQEVSDLVDVRAVNSAKALGTQLDDMNKSLEDRTSTFAEFISTKSDQLEGLLQGHGNILRQALDSNASESETLMKQWTSRILGDVNEALKKLNDSNILLNRVLESSSDNLARLEGSVATQTENYSSTVRDALGSTEEAGRLVTEHVGALQVTIGSMVREFSGIIGNLETETGNIDRAANTLKDAGNFSIDTLENRRGAMEALAESFAARADDIDERMRNFAQSISEAVNDTERRLIAAREGMEDSLNATSDSVARRIESFSHAADGEGQRASEVLRQTQQDMLSEMQSAFDDATRRFNDTASAMRATASQVGSELEATRSELQRGVMELPEETRASAAAMRRVVAEQIEALNELNSIVRAQPATHDVGSRRSSPAPRASAREQAPEGPVRSAPQRRSEPVAPRMEDDILGLSRALVEARTSVDTRDDDLESDRMQDEGATKTLAPAPKAEGDNGWLRDVLRNASAKQAQSSVSTTRTVNLSNLTDEIARATDATALADAWQRYQSGESNVFSRRIYTLTGQGTFDDVRKKLQRDPEFARVAGSYMDEFEQMLQAAARSPGYAEETEELLLSDRGKVYTMLAHASGRLN